MTIPRVFQEKPASRQPAVWNGKRADIKKQSGGEDQGMSVAVTAEFLRAHVVPQQRRGERRVEGGLPPRAPGSSSHSRAFSVG